MMGWIRSLLVRLGRGGGLDRIDREIDEELRFHLDMRIESNLAKGMSEQDARADAHRRLGDMGEIRRRGRSLLAGAPPSSGGRTWSETLAYEMRLALRTLVRRPLLAGPATVSLGLGISIAVSVFWAADTVTLRPLAFSDAERLIMVWHTDPERGWNEAELSARDFLDFRNEAQTAELAGFWPTSLNLSETRSPERVDALRVTANLMQVLGIDPVAGRGFLPDEETPGRSPVTILSHTLGTRHFGTAAAALGAAIRLDGVERTVVGVLPPGVPPPFAQAGAWIPLEIDREGNRQARGLRVVGRLRDGFSLNDAGDEMSALAGTLAAAYPESNRGLDARAVPFRTFVFPEGVQVGSLVLLGASLAVLLIAAANVVNLLLAGATSRRRELAVRSALGGTRAQVARQLLTESVLLGLAGGGIGVLFSLWGVHLIRAQAGETLAAAIGIDGRVLLVAVAVSLLTGIAVGAGPAMTGTRWIRRHGLSAVGRDVSSGSGESRTQKLLVVSQMTLAVALVATMVLTGRVFLTHRSEDLGFRTGDLLTFRTTLDAAEHPTDDDVRLFFGRLRSEIQVLPGVERAAAVSLAPLTDMNTGYSYLPEGETYEPGRWPLAPFRVVTAGYFRTMDIPLIAGRAFTEGDHAGSPPVVIVSRYLARRHWPRGDAVGRRLQLGGISRAVVGVTGDVQLFGPDTPPTQVIYLPFDQFPRREMDLVLRTADADASASAVGEVMHRIDPDQPLFSLQTMGARHADELRGDRVAVLVVGSAGVLALLLAMVGVYGVIAHWSAQRRGQTGVRIVLGASRRDVLAMVLGQGLRLSVTGAALGALLMAFVWWPLSTSLYESPSFDPLAILAAGGLVVLGGAVAALMPALRASHTDPADTLRQE